VGGRGEGETATAPDTEKISLQKANKKELVSFLGMQSLYQKPGGRLERENGCLRKSAHFKSWLMEVL